MILMNKNSVILVTGVKGQLGFDCVRELKKRGYKNIFAIDKEELDITNKNDVDNYICNLKPSVVMHNAAWTAVDKAEEMPAEAYNVNALGTKYIAEACNKIDATLVYISTDYVFPGNGTNFYEINDKKNPLSVYGKSKSDGEDFVITALKKYFIVRISWVFGINGNNFIKTILKLAKSKNQIEVVNDQFGSLTYTFDLAKLLCDMIETSKYGIYHATKEGVVSWYDVAQYIVSFAKLPLKVNPISTKDYQAKFKQANRPLNSRLAKTSLLENGFNLLPDWHDAVNRFLLNELILDKNNI